MGKMVSQGEAISNSLLYQHGQDGEPGEHQDEEEEEEREQEEK